MHALYAGLVERVSQLVSQECFMLSTALHFHFSAEGKLAMHYHAAWIQHYIAQCPEWHAFYF